ncbi:MAG: hypothetical protein OHK0039_43310 [Bacteroidia bacterium]
MIVTYFQDSIDIMEIMVEVATVQGQLLHRIWAQDTDALSIALPEASGHYLLRVSADGHRSVARVLRE